MMFISEMESESRCDFKAGQNLQFLLSTVRVGAPSLNAMSTGLLSSPLISPSSSPTKRFSNNKIVSINLRTNQGIETGKIDSQYVSASSFSLLRGFFAAAAPPPERSWSISLPKVAAPDCWVCLLRAGGYSRKDPAGEGEEGPAQPRLASFQPGLTD